MGGRNQSEYPFDKLVNGMLQEQTLREITSIIQTAVQENIETIILVNNRAGGNAPEVALRIGEQFIKTTNSV